MAEGYRHQHPPPLPPQVRPGFPPPLGRPPPPPPPPLTCAPPPPPPPRFQAPPPNLPPTPPLIPPETESSAQKKTDQSEDRQSDSSHDTLVKDGREVKRSGGGFAPLKQTLMKGKDDTKSDTGSKVKISLGGGGFGSVGGSGLLGKRAAGNITMKLKPQMEAGNSKKVKTELPPKTKPSSNLVAQAFGSDSEEEEEMPPEARLRMRNMGKDTPTSAGPNSFNKSVKGFSDPRGSWRNELDD